MNRRKFIKQSSILSIMPALPLPNLSDTSSKYKMGYQLFSIRDEMEIDPIATLTILKEMGYEDFETYGYDAEQDSFYGIKAIRLKSILDDMNLSATSGHFGFSDYFGKSKDDLKRFVDDCIKGALQLNLRYITWPWLDPRYRNIESFKMLAEKLNLIGEQVNSAQLGFAYHNHGYEFDYVDGICGYDIIMNETDPTLVKLQLDMYWLAHSSKLTPTELIDKQPGRFVMWHIKDMDKKTRDYTELGNGSIDYVKLMPNPVKSGLEFYYLEQGGNYAQNSTQSALTSASFFKKHLQHLF